MPRQAVAVYAGIAVADAALAVARRHRGRWLTKPLLMPTLMLGRGRGTQRALGLSGLGDVALLNEGKVAFTTGLGSFLAGHLAWIAELRGRPRNGTLVSRPALATPYVVACVGLNGYLWSRTGSDRVPVLAYSAVLTAMALAALDTGEPATVAGGALFMLSDSLLALEKFGGIALPAHEALVMATYTTAQALLARGDAG